MLDRLLDQDREIAAPRDGIVRPVERDDDGVGARPRRRLKEPVTPVAEPVETQQAPRHVLLVPDQWRAPAGEQIGPGRDRKEQAEADEEGQEPAAEHDAAVAKHRPTQDRDDDRQRHEHGERPLRVIAEGAYQPHQQRLEDRHHDGGQQGPRHLAQIDWVHSRAPRRAGLMSLLPALQRPQRLDLAGGQRRGGVRRRERPLGHPPGGRPISCRPVRLREHVAVASRRLRGVHPRLQHLDRRGGVSGANQFERACRGQDGPGLGRPRHRRPLRALRHGGTLDGRRLRLSRRSGLNGLSGRDVSCYAE